MRLIESRSDRVTAGSYFSMFLNRFRPLARRLKHNLLNSLRPQRKATAELMFWGSEIRKYQDWFNGKIPFLYETRAPAVDAKVRAPNPKDSSILTWHALHQEPKYLDDLDLPPQSFVNKRILDIGSGPIPSATCFKECTLYCLDPLLPRYMEAGFPIHYYRNVYFVNAFSEDMPFLNGFFDAVIAVNSIDHVNNIARTALEIERILKPEGLLRLHVHYHQATITEPIELDDHTMAELFGWCKGFRKIRTSKHCHSGQLPDTETFTLWSNF